MVRQDYILFLAIQIITPCLFYVETGLIAPATLLMFPDFMGDDDVRGWWEECLVLFCWLRMRKGQHCLVIIIPYVNNSQSAIIIQKGILIFIPFRSSFPSSFWIILLKLTSSSDYDLTSFWPSLLNPILISCCRQLQLRDQETQERRRRRQQEKQHNHKITRGLSSHFPGLPSLYYCCHRHLSLDCIKGHQDRTNQPNIPSVITKVITDG